MGWTFFTRTELLSLAAKLNGREKAGQPAKKRVDDMQNNINRTTSLFRKWFCTVTVIKIQSSGLSNA